MTEILNTWFVGANSRKTALSLYAKFGQKNQPLLLFAHGFKGFKDWGHFPQICQAFAERGIATLAFNFSHNGGTVESPIDFPDLAAFAENNYSKELEDIELLLLWIKSNKASYFQDIDVSRITLLGHSRGGGIALLATHRFAEIKKVITWAAVTDFAKRMPSEEQMEHWKTTGVHFIRNGRTKQDMPMNYQFVQNYFDNKEQLDIELAVKNTRKPMLIIHGYQDETVAYSDAAQIQEWNKQVQLVGIDDCNHTFNGRHPWEEENLPLATQTAIQASLEFILA